MRLRRRLATKCRSYRRASSPRSLAPPARLGAAGPPINAASYDNGLAGSPYRFGDYKAGEKIDHTVGVTVEDAEHMMATRLYQNTARAHFDHFTESKGRFGKRLIYGGHP